MGLIIIWILFGQISSEYLLLLSQILTDELIDSDLSEILVKNDRLISLYDFSNRLSLRLTDNLKDEYCCFYHFLIG
jgi:hypothetical protein